MEVPAQLNFITVRGERTELSICGKAQVKAHCVVLSYVTDDYDMRIEVCEHRAVIVRGGRDGYSMTLSRGKDCYLQTSEGRLTVRTKKFFYKAAPHSLMAAATYDFGDEDTTTKVIIKAIY